MKPEEVDRILQNLWLEEMPPGMKVYAILDAARNEKIYPAVQSCPLEWTSLYLGKIPQALEEVAPYLVCLEKNDPFTKRLIADGWDDNWGIYIWAPTGLVDLRQHLRKFLMVADESGKQLVFRFYDPRVFRAFLPTCDEEQARDFFGPVQEFIVPDKEPLTVLKFRLEEGRVLQQKASA